MVPIDSPWVISYSTSIDPSSYLSSFLKYLAVIFMTLNQYIMGVDPWVYWGHVPLLFEVEGTPCVLSPTFSGVHIFCTNTHGIRWMIAAIFVKLVS